MFSQNSLANQEQAHKKISIKKEALETISQLQPPSNNNNNMKFIAISGLPLCLSMCEWVCVCVCVYVCAANAITNPR